MPHISLNTCALIGHLAPPGARLLETPGCAPHASMVLTLDVAPHRRIAIPCEAHAPALIDLALKQVAGQRLMIRGALSTDEACRLVVVAEAITPILS